MARTETELRQAFGDLVVEQALLASIAEKAHIVRAWDGNLSCRMEGEWYAITAAGRQHKRACDEIAHLGFVPYLPIEVVPVRAGRRVREVERSMFGPYMFVHCPGIAFAFAKIATARGVGEVVRLDGQAPRPIPNGKIEAIRLYEAKLRAADEAVRTRAGMVWHFSAGDAVRIKEGPFAGFYAQLETAVDHRDRIKAAIDIFGRPTLAEISAFDIEAA